MRGTIRLGAWRRFTARQVITPPDGYIWAATARVAGMPVIGYDRLSSGAGQMRWRLVNLVPLMSAVGADITMSARGRLATEIVLLPTAFRTFAWARGDDADTAVGSMQVGAEVGGESEEVRLRIRSDGSVKSVETQRWGNPNGGPYGRYPFGATIEAERRFGGVTMPSLFRAAWHFGTDRQDGRRVLPRRDNRRNVPLIARLPPAHACVEGGFAPA